MLGNIRLGKVCVNFSHGLVVGPATYLHSDFLRYIQVESQGSEAVAEAVEADLGEAAAFADAVHLVHDGSRVEGDHIFAVGSGVLQGLPEGRDNGDYPAGGGIFGFPLIDNLMILIRDGGAVNGEDTVREIHIGPAEADDLGAAQAGQGQQCGDLRFVTLHSIDEYGDLLRGQPGTLGGDDLGKPDGDALAGGLGNDGSQEAPGVGEGFRGDGLGLQVDGTLPLLWSYIEDVPVHHVLKPVILDGAVTPNGGGGEDIAPGIDISIDGLGKGFLVGFTGGIFNAGLHGHGFRDGLLLGISGDGDILPIDADTAEPGTGGKLPGFGYFHLTFLSWYATIRG